MKDHRSPHVAAVLTCLCLLLPASPSWAFRNCTTMQLSTTPSALPMEGSDPVVVGSHVYMTYVIAGEVVFLASADGGVTFTSQRLNGTEKASVAEPRIAAFGSNVYVVWGELTGGFNQVMFRQSTDEGATFGPVVTLGKSVPIKNPTQIAADGLNVSVIFVYATGEPAVASSKDGGKTWPNIWVQTGVKASPSELSIGRLGQRIVAHVTSRDDSTGINSNLVATSADGGVTFTTKPLVKEIIASMEPLIAVSRTTGYWYIYTMDYYDVPPSHKVGKGTGTLYTSQDGGFTWTRQFLSFPSSQGAIVVDGSTVYLSWLQFIPRQNHVYLSYSTDSGATFSTPVDLSGPVNGPNLDEVFLPQISAHDGDFSIAYASQGNVWARSTPDITRGLSAPVLLGPGTNTMIDHGSVLWLGPGIGQFQPAYYGLCR